MVEADRADIMPTIHRSGPYRLFFYSADGDEPMHVHVERDACEAKFWLDPVRLEGTSGFGSRELRRVEALVRLRAARLRETWDEYFNT